MSSYKYFQNRSCKYFPCHSPGDDSDFNCLFCYCPLYFLGTRCPGNFSVFYKDGITYKDCTPCQFPHRKENYSQVVSLLERFLPCLKVD